MSGLKSKAWIDVATALLVGVCACSATFAVIVWCYGEPPAEILTLLVRGTWGTPYGAGQVLFKASPLLFTGLAVTIALRAGLFNVGAEGQLAVGSLATGLVASRLPAGTPALVALPIALAASAFAGGAWAALPALLRTRLRAHEVISTIVMNQIATALVGIVLSSSLAVHGASRTYTAVSGALIPRLSGLFPALRGSAASVAFPLAVLLPFVASTLLRRSRVGRELSLTGQNPTACEYAKIPTGRRMEQAFVLSGAIAGLASAATVLGYKGYYETGLGAGAGFGGLAVALLAFGRPTLLIFAAILFATLEQGGLAVNGKVPMAVMDVMQGVIIVVVAVTTSQLQGPPPRLKGAR